MDGLSYFYFNDNQAIAVLFCTSTITYIFVKNCFQTTKSVIEAASVGVNNGFYSFDDKSNACNNLFTNINL